VIKMKQIDHDQLLRSIQKNYGADRLHAMENGNDFKAISDTYFKILLLIQMATKDVKEPEADLFPIYSTGKVCYTEGIERSELQALSDDEYMQWLYDNEH